MTTPFPPPISVDGLDGKVETPHDEMDAMAHRLFHASGDGPLQGAANVLMTLLEERHVLYGLLADIVRSADRDDPVHAFTEPTIKAARAQLGWPEE